MLTDSTLLGYYSSSIISNIFWVKKVGKKSVVVVFFVFCAVGGHPPTRPFRLLKLPFHRYLSKNGPYPVSHYALQRRRRRPLPHPPTFSNSPVRRYLSNGQYPVPHFALLPQFCRPQPPPKISVLCVPKISLDRGEIFRFSLFGGFAGSGTVPGGFYGKFQYRTIRFCGVS